MDTKVCSECGIELPIDEFYPRKGYKDGYYPYCRKCLSVKNKANRQMRRSQVKSLSDRLQMISDVQTNDEALLFGVSVVEEALDNFKSVMTNFVLDYIDMAAPDKKKFIDKMKEVTESFKKDLQDVTSI